MFGTFRIYLSILVVLVHYARVPMVGEYAVFGFFMLSGFLITLILQESYGYGAKGFFAFAVNRLLRIYPIFWVSLLIGIAIILLMGPELTTAVNPQFFLPQTAQDWLAHVFIILRFDTSPAVNPAAWTLTIELVFYLAMGVGLSRNRAVTLLWLLASAGFTYWMLHEKLPFGPRYSTLGAASLPFAMGAFIYHWRSEIDAWLGWLIKPRFAPHALISLSLLNCYIGLSLGTENTYNFYLNLPIYALIILSLYPRKELPLITKRQDHWLGLLTYPLYAVHLPLAYLFLFISASLGIATRPSIPFFLVTFVPLMAVTWLVTFGVEGRVEQLRQKIKERSNIRV